MPKIVGFIGTVPSSPAWRFEWLPVVMAGATSYGLLLLAAVMPGRALVPNAPGAADEPTGLKEYSPEIMGRVADAVRAVRAGEKKGVPVPPNAMAKVMALPPGRFSYDTTPKTAPVDQKKPGPDEIHDAKRVRIYKRKTSLKAARYSASRAASGSYHQHLLIDTLGERNPDGTYQQAQPVVVASYRADGYPTFMIEHGKIQSTADRPLLTKDEINAKRDAREIKREQRRVDGASNAKKAAEKTRALAERRAKEAEERKARTDARMAEVANASALLAVASAQRAESTAQRVESSKERKETAAEYKLRTALSPRVPRAPRAPKAPAPPGAAVAGAAPSGATATGAVPPHKRAQKRAEDAALMTRLRAPAPAPAPAPDVAPAASERGGTVLSFEGDGPRRRATVQWDGVEKPELISAADTQKIRAIKIRTGDRFSQTIRLSGRGVEAFFDAEGIAAPAAAPAVAPAVAPQPRESSVYAGTVYYLIDYAGTKGSSKGLARVIELSGDIKLEDAKKFRDAGVGPGGKFSRIGQRITPVRGDAQLTGGQKDRLARIGKLNELKAARAAVAVQDKIKADRFKARTKSTK
jgi:hypothetical protein